MSIENAEKFFKMANNNKNLQKDLRELGINEFSKQENFDAVAASRLLKELSILSKKYEIPFTVDEYLKFSAILCEKAGLTK